jgi:hypothetical protein
MLFKRAGAEPHYSATRDMMLRWLDLQMQVWAFNPKLAKLLFLWGAGEGQGTAMIMHHTQG